MKRHDLIYRLYGHKNPSATIAELIFLHIQTLSLATLTQLVSSSNLRPLHNADMMCAVQRDRPPCLLTAQDTFRQRDTGFQDEFRSQITNVRLRGKETELRLTAFSWWIGPELSRPTVLLWNHLLSPSLSPPPFLSLSFVLSSPSFLLYNHLLISLLSKLCSIPE